MRAPRSCSAGIPPATHAARGRWRYLGVVGIVLAVVASAGCSASRDPPRPEAHASSRDGGTSAAEATELNRLKRTYDQRTSMVDGLHTPVGPGDVLEFSVPARAELHHTTVRVAGDGTISLPLLGTIPVAGLDEPQLAQDIRDRLAKYMYKPQLSLLVKEYRSRQVGVLGSVAKPGLQVMSSANDTILDMISEAGGLTPEATQRILFMPVEAIPAAEAKDLIARGAAPPPPSALLAGNSSAQLIRAANPIVINLEEMDPAARQLALSVPVRPGDTIIALGGGQVFVQGWVERPGSYPLTRGLTLLGAVAAAGGPSFPADKNSVRILRDTRSGDKVVLTADLEVIGHGDGQDILLREGDLVDISATGGKLAAYSVYQFFTTVLRVGASVPIF